MRKLRLTPLGNMITTVSLAIGAGTSIVIYIWVVILGGHTAVRGPLLWGALIAVLVSLGIGIYFARLVAQRVQRIDEAARAIADGDFTGRIPVDYSGQLGQLARTFNEMQRRLAELDSARKQFIANASHELRTPIFSLGGFVELLEEEDPSPEERAEFMRTMRQQIERLTKLTTDLLNLSQLDAGGVELESRTVDLSELAREVVREFGPRADRRGSRLELRTPEWPVIAVGDPERVRQIIRILLDNALVHTPEGAGVTVTTYSVNRRAQLTVSDDGPGIPQRVQKRIFERFYTADSAGGSGLGLAIARELAQRMNGSMAISSSRRFTAFTLDLPLSPRKASTPPAPALPERARTLA
jgi:two-component system, OmpR family, sensor kinase